MELIVILVVLLVLSGSIMGIVAAVRVRHLGELYDGGDHAKISELERRLSGVEKALSQLVNQADKPAKSAEAPPVVLPPQTPTPAPTRVPQPIPTPMASIPQPKAPPVTPQVPAEKLSWLSPAPPVSTTSATAPQAPAREPEIFTTKHEGGVDLESQVAGKWLNYVGIVALLFATAFFIKYAFDNGWVGPRGRVGIGLLAGTLLLLWSKRLLRHGYKYFSEGIAGLGAAVLYLSIWGGWNYYRIFTSGQAFAAMVVITGVMVAVALRRDSQRIAMLALAGGFLTPMLVSTGQDHEIVLFTYCAILSAGMLALERVRSWKWLPPVAFVATEVYFWGWYNEFYTPEKLGKTIAFAALFFVVFAALPLVRSRREGRIDDTEYFVAIANVLVILFAFQQILWPDYRWALTLAYLALAALHFVAAQTLPAPKPGMEDATLHLRWLFAGLAILCLSLAIPARFDHEWLTMAWAAEGVMLVWYGVKIDSWKLRSGGLVFFVITGIRLLILPIPAHRFLWNDRFFTYAIAVICFSLSCQFTRKIRDRVSQDERTAFIALAVGANVFALIGLSLELWDYFSRPRIQGLEPWTAQQLALLLLWAVYATGLILNGLMRKAEARRWPGIVLLLASAVWLPFLDIPAPTFLWNVRFLAYAILIACFVICWRFAARMLADLRAEERNAYIAIAVAAHAHALISLSLELSNLCDRRPILGLSYLVQRQLALVLLWALFGTGLILTGILWKSRLRRWPGIALLLAAAVWLLTLEIHPQTFLWNVRFLAYAVIVACFASSRRFSRRLLPDLSQAERNVFSALAVEVNLYALIALSFEIWDLFGRTQTLGIERWLAQQLGLSVLWTLYAGGLIAVGLARRLAMLRWQALALFALVVGKVFLYDMSSLDKIYRIISFLVRGVLLLGVSFAYQKRAMAQKAEKKP